MQALLPYARPQSLFDVASTRRLEARRGAGLPAGALMQRAGAAIARLAVAIAPHAQRVIIAAGPGNNGGDGMAAACRLHAMGRHVFLCWLGDPARLTPDARVAWEQTRSLGLQLHAAAHAWPALTADDLAIDALLGIGANREPSFEVRAAIERLNALPCPTLAVDAPSGLNADTGIRWGDAAVRAAHTLTFITAKPGLFGAEGRDHAGRVWLDDLGIGARDEAPVATLGHVDAQARWPARAHAQHKGSFGDVAVVGGAAGMSGAARLAARAAHAAGAGRVYLSPSDGAAPTDDAERPELMHRDRWWEREPVEGLQKATVVCGCGGGGAVATALPRLLHSAARIVLDADALNAVAMDEALWPLLCGRAPRGLPTVLTPHPLEAARLLGVSTPQIQSDRLRCARELADRFRCIVVLKGSGTVIASASRVPVINGTGTAALATAGTGDVLAGWLGGRWAANTDLDAFEIAARAVMEHGQAADRSRHTTLRAADLVDALYALNIER